MYVYVSVCIAIEFIETYSRWHRNVRLWRGIYGNGCHTDCGDIVVANAHARTFTVTIACLAERKTHSGSTNSFRTQFIRDQ